MDTFTFEHLKKVVKEAAAQRLLCIADKEGLTSLIWFDETWSKRYKTRNDLRKELGKEISWLVGRVDVRNYSVLLELCPKGYDDRIPSWLYEPTVTPELGEDGWIFNRPTAGI